MKSLSDNCENEHGGMAISLRVGISVAVAYLGGVASTRCSAVAHAREAVKRCQCTHRHLLMGLPPPIMMIAPPLDAHNLHIPSSCVKPNFI